MQMVQMVAQVSLIAQQMFPSIGVATACRSVSPRGGGFEIPGKEKSTAG